MTIEMQQSGSEGAESQGALELDFVDESGIIVFSKSIYSQTPGDEALRRIVLFSVPAFRSIAIRQQSADAVKLNVFRVIYGSKIADAVATSDCDKEIKFGNGNAGQTDCQYRRRIVQLVDEECGEKIN